MQEEKTKNFSIYNYHTLRMVLTKIVCYPQLVYAGAIYLAINVI